LGSPRRKRIRRKKDKRLDSGLAIALFPTISPYNFPRGEGKERSQSRKGGGKTATFQMVFSPPLFSPGGGEATGRKKRREKRGWKEGNAAIQRSLLALRFDGDEGEHKKRKKRGK